MEAVLTIATILGGIAALWYFWDKIVAVFHRKSTFGKPAPPPAQAAAAQTPDPVEKWVDFRYPRDSGLQRRLEQAGYKVAWCLDTKLARKVDLEGWEVVVEPDSNGTPSKYRLKDRPANQTLIKKRAGQ